MCVHWQLTVYLKRLFVRELGCGEPLPALYAERLPYMPAV